MENEKKQLAIIRKDDKLISAVFCGQKLDNVIVDTDSENQPKVGDIYVCRVSHVVQNINAAFVEIQKDTMCYLPLNDINTMEGKVVQGQEFPVQIKKAAVKTKQAVVSRKLEFTGRYAVITTINTAKTISTKITDERQRLRLQEILMKFDEPTLGIILRTGSKDASETDIISECNQLLDTAHEVMERATYRTAFTRLHTSSVEYMKYLLNYPHDYFHRIVTDDSQVWETLTKSMASTYDNLQLYEDTSYSLDKLFGISSKLNKALDKHVWLKSGGSLVIEPTEALTVIDVNTEKAIAGKRNMETTFFKVNCEAAVEAARQIRIRNISGIILIDFIDMKKKEHERQLLSILEEEFTKDDVRTTVVDITKLGLVEITRMKVRKPLWESL